MAAYYAGGGDEWAKVVVCDSTHFADGASIAPTIEALATFGNYAGYGNPPTPVKNRGHVYGNNTFPGGLGTAELNDVATDLAGMKKTPLSSDQAYKSDILGTILPVQVFFINNLYTRNFQRYRRLRRRWHRRKERRQCAG